MWNAYFEVETVLEREGEWHSVRDKKGWELNFV